MNLRIGIDAHSAERDGTGNCTYTRNLITHLTSLDTNNQYILFVTDPEHSFYKSLLNRSNVSITSVSRSPAWYRVFFALPAASKRMRIDVLHVQYFAPFSQKARLVNTIHDAAPFRYPKYFSRFERVLFRLLLPASARKARIILTDSQVSKTDLVTLIHLPPEKIRVVYCGVDQSYFSHNDPVASSESLLQKYGVKRKFLLYVGRIDPRKNLNRLVQAYTHLRKNTSIEHQLIVAGRVYLQPEELAKTLQASEFKNDIHFCGFVPDQDLPWLYKSADVLVYTSEYEGFGLPPLEAIASGIPVIASDIPIFREILEDAAFLVNPRDVHSIAEGILKILTDEKLRKDLIEKGKERVHRFTWDRTALATLQCYEDAMKDPAQ